MRKRCTGLLLAMALIAAQSVTALAAGSVSGGSSGGGDGHSVGSSSSTTSGTTSGDNASQSAASNGFASGSNVSAGSSSASVGSKSLSFATGEAATAGLPGTAVNAINAINQGKELSSAVSGVNVEGCAALTETKAIVVADAETQQVTTGKVEVNLYVANLVNGLKEVQILFYDNATNTWSVIVPTKVDFATKQLSFDINGSGTYSVIYKK